MHYPCSSGKLLISPVLPSGVVQRSPRLQPRRAPLLLLRWVSAIAGVAWSLVSRIMQPHESSWQAGPLSA